MPASAGASLLHHLSKGFIMRNSFISQRRALLAGAGIAAGVAVFVAGTGVASAHMGVDLHGATPTAGSGSTIFLRPGHGCDGDATNAITVNIPAGVTNVKAQQKAGWKITASPTQITWSGGNLPDDQFDDFGLKLTWPSLPAGVTSQKFYFQAVQTCNAELKVTRTGADATVTGRLPEYAGQKAALFVDGIPLTIHDVLIGADGTFSVATKAAKVPEGADVVAKVNGRQVGNSKAGVDAWLDIPAAGSTAALAMPAPSVTVVAPAPAAK
jgi:uncharacterized protein YcnI